MCAHIYNYLHLLTLHTHTYIYIHIFIYSYIFILYLLYAYILSYFLAVSRHTRKVPAEASKKKLKAAEDPFHGFATEVGLAIEMLGTLW